MHSHHIALAIADARVADLQRAATHSTATAPPRRHRRTLALLGLAATAALSALAPTGALAQPIHDTATPANAHAEAVHRDHSPTATRQSITFTNPLGRSRGPGAGAGLLNSSAPESRGRRSPALRPGDRSPARVRRPHLGRTETYASGREGEVIEVRSGGRAGGRREQLLRASSPGPDPRVTLLASSTDSATGLHGIRQRAACWRGGVGFARGQSVSDGAPWCPRATRQQIQSKSGWSSPALRTATPPSTYGVARA